MCFTMCFTIASAGLQCPVLHLRCSRIFLSPQFKPFWQVRQSPAVAVWAPKFATKVATLGLLPTTFWLSKPTATTASFVPTINITCDELCTCHWSDKEDESNSEAESRPGSPEGPGPQVSAGSVSSSATTCPPATRGHSSAASQSTTKATADKGSPSCRSTAARESLRCHGPSGACSRARTHEVDFS